MKVVFKMGPNWRPKVLAILGAVGFIIAAFSYLLDDDPETKFDMMGVIQAIGAILAALGWTSGLLTARDSKVTSEESGAIEARKVREAKKDD